MHLSQKFSKHQNTSGIRKNFAYLVDIYRYNETIISGIT